MRAVHHVGGDTQARQVAPQPFHDFQPLPDRGPEVPRADHGVAVEDVVRPDLDAKQGPHQFAHGLEGVVDAL